MIIAKKVTPVKFYAELSGNEPVRDWLKELNKQERKILGEDIKAIQLRWPVGLPLVKPLSEGLWEIRSKLTNRIVRIIFCFHDGCIVLLHGFIKKTQKISANDLKIARKRAKNLEG